MDSMNFAALDALAGEVLPERAVLGVISTPFNNAGGDGGAAGSASSAAAASAGGGSSAVDGGGAVTMSACQSQVSEGTPGLLGSLGLGSNNPTATMTCVPASTATY